MQLQNLSAHNLNISFWRIKGKSWRPKGAQAGEWILWDQIFSLTKKSEKTNRREE
jgi:hypothetical protein